MSNETVRRIREGFPHQRLVRLPAAVTARCAVLPVVRALYVTDIGFYPAAPHHYVFRRGGSDQAILIYCLKGTGRLEIGGEMHEIQAGHLVLIPPHIPHMYQATGDAGWSIFWIHFSGEQTQSVLESLSVTRTRPLLYVADRELMRNAFEEVYACLNYHGSDAGLLAMSSELLRLISKAKLHQGSLQPQRRSAEERVLATRGFMQEHLDMPLTLRQLADVSGQSIPYYCKLFKERTDQAPMTYFTQLKIRKACELLDQTEEEIQTIARQLGFEDPYYFSRIFKKVQGCSPSAYRGRQKG